MARRHQAQVQAEWVRFSPGVLHGLSNAIEALSDAGDGVIIQTPVYYPFKMIIEAANRVVIENPLIEKEGTYEMNLEDLQHKHVSFMSLPNQVKLKALVFISPSKTFNLAGLQTSAVIIPDEAFRLAYDKAASHSRTTGINVFGETALVAAYDQCEYYVDELMSYLTKNLEFVRQTLQTRFPQLSLFEPQGTYLLWIDFRTSGIPLKELESFMSQKARLAVDAGGWFGTAGEGFIRLNIACPKSQLEAAFNRLETAFKSVK